MEHAKKLMLIENKLFRPSMREKTLTRLDEEIERTLHSDLPDNEKAIKYMESLRQYKYYKSPHTNFGEETEENAESKVLSSFSVAQKHKAKRLLEHLKWDKDVQISKKGGLVYKEQKIQQSYQQICSTIFYRKNRLRIRSVGEN